MKVTRRTYKNTLQVLADDTPVVSHAGSALLVELADRIGLTDDLSAAMAPTRQRPSAHDPGRVVRDLAVMLADGGDCLADLGALRDQVDLHGAVASDSTAWRVIAAIDAEHLDRIRAARASARARAWAAGARPDQIVLDIDSTLVTSHSEKEGAAPTYTRGFGFHPMLCYLDGTGEALAGVLRTGNAGTNTAADHIGVLVDALNQLPGEVREEEGCRFLEGPRAHPRPSALRKNGARRPENPGPILGQNAVPWAILLTCVLNTTRQFAGKTHDQPKRPADVPHLVSHLHTRRACRCWWCIRWCEVPERPLRKCPYRASGVGAGRGMRPRSGRTCGLWRGPRRALRDSP